MTNGSPTSQDTERRPHGGRYPALASLLFALACTGLAACGSTSNPVTQASAREAKLARQEHSELVELVDCARRHGIHLPPPTAANKVITRGVNLKSRRRKAALSACYHTVIGKAAKEREAEGAREGTSAKPSEEPPQSPTQAAAAPAKEHDQLIEVVTCARRHGIHLPEPDAHNHVSTRGVNLKSHNRKAIMNDCLRKVVSQATKEQEEEELAREHKKGPRRLGEEPATP